MTPGPYSITGLHPPSKRALVGWNEVLRALVKKELKVKYKRSVLGFMWSLVTPVALTGVYLFVFVYVYKVNKPDFILFALSGLLPWNYFNMSVLASTNTLIDNAPLIRKVYFPRVLLPVSTVLSNLVTFLMGLSFLIVLVVFAGRPVWLFAHWLVLAVVLQSALCVGVALALSIWNVYFRDIGQLIGILILVAFFATPVIYEFDQVPDPFHRLMLLNPLTGIMELYRSSLFRPGNPPATLIFVSAIETLLVLGFGYRVFRKRGPVISKEL